MKHLLRHYDGGLALTTHGKESFAEATGVFWSNEAIVECISKSKLVKIEDVRLNGYNPNFTGRAIRGIKSWYAVSKEFGWKAVFVLSEGNKTTQDLGTIVLITVLYRKLEAIKILENRDKYPQPPPKPKIDANCIMPNAFWESGNMRFQCVVCTARNRRRIMFKGYIDGKIVHACAPNGQKRFSDHNELLKLLESGIKHYYDSSVAGSICELKQPLTHVEHRTTYD